ncbi:MAG: prolyl oligopeptidase family serine peptidase [Phycisphaerae bacterium]|jgi:predicted peptidase
MHVHTLLPLGLAGLFALVVAAADEPSAPPVGQRAQVLEKQVTVRFDYLLYLPKDYNEDATKKWPMILFLHGAGERGRDVNRVKIHGPPKLIDKGREFPFIIVSPQCPPDTWWEPFSLKVLLDEIEARYRVDPDRVYVTGLSMGGFGTWDLAARFPERFAAIAPICGGGNPVVAGRIRRLPAWVFHGEADPVVPFKRSQEMVDALKAVGGDVKFTSYPGVGHDSWTATYENPELYQWFLSHKRGDRPATRPGR